MKVTAEIVKHIAKLAKINLAESEVQKYTNEFNSIMEYISVIDEFSPTTSDSALTPPQKVKVSNTLNEEQTHALYKDEVEPSNITTEKIAKNATQGRFKNGYIRTSKVINKD